MSLRFSATRPYDGGRRLGGSSTATLSCSWAKPLCAFVLCVLVHSTSYGQYEVVPFHSLEGLSAPQPNALVTPAPHHVANSGYTPTPLPYALPNTSTFSAPLPAYSAGSPVGLRSVSTSAAFAPRVANAYPPSGRFHGGSSVPGTSPPVRSTYQSPVASYVGNGSAHVISTPAGCGPGCGGCQSCVPSFGQMGMQSYPASPIASPCGVPQPFTSYPTCYGYGYEVDHVHDSYWYGGGRVVYMHRDRADNVWLTLDTGSLPRHLLDSHNAEMGGRFGTEAYVGKAFDCGNYAWEARYWGIFSNVREANVLATVAVGNLDTPIDFTPLVYDNGGGAAGVGTFFTNAETHRVRRSFEVHNVELNFMRLLAGNSCTACGPSVSCSPCATGCGSCDAGCSAAAAPLSPLQVRWLAGVRYFRFDEGFQLATDRGNITFGDDPLEELYYDIDVANHLIGFQAGCRIDYGDGCGRWNIHSDTKVGLYGNHITHSQRIFGLTNVAIVDDVGGPFHNQAYDISSTKTDVSVLAEFDLGIDVAINSCWSAGLGYRAAGVTGVGLTTAQIPRFFEDLGEARRIDSTGSLLLHGAYAQIEYVR